MTYVPKDNQITLFANKYKQSGDNKPDVKGSGTVMGVAVDVAGWNKDGRISLKFSEPYKKSETHKGFDGQGDIPQRDDMEDTIPF